MNIIDHHKNLKKMKKWVKISNENIFWYGRSPKMAKTPIQKPVCFFGQKSVKNGNLGN
jgi:retron-type reverse transcriptase